MSAGQSSTQSLVNEWIAVAEGDYSSLLREMRARKNPNYGDACFHVQQCVEKYLKTLLIREGTSFPRTHNLLDLMNLLLPADGSWALLQQDSQILSYYAVAVGYPGNVVLKETARDAQGMCRDIRRKARTSLGLPD